MIGADAIIQVIVSIALIVIDGRTPMVVEVDTCSLNMNTKDD
jgi:hypothetical protein